MAFKKGHLPDHEVEKFTKNATNAYHRALAYIEKWYPFENQNYKTFSCLNLECGRLPTLDQLLELRSISPWKQQTPPEQIYDELAALQSVFPSLKLEGNSIEMWCKFFQKGEAPNLLKIVQFVCSVPVSNAFVKRIFSVMGNVKTRVFGVEISEDKGFVAVFENSIEFGNIKAAVWMFVNKSDSNLNAGVYLNDNNCTFESLSGLKNDEVLNRIFDKDGSTPPLCVFLSLL
ncbi:dimer_Tnp_hAT domain-containing protein [Trichonephila clavipes]|nr:dimer_Tnp_hAT domain-containing protein [Trichonephila clavipes]